MRQGTGAARGPRPLRPRGGFGGYLHELRMERGLTARQLAAAAGVHHTYVSKLERGDRQAPDEPVVEALAAALGATPAQIDQLRWRAGLAPRGAGAPGQDDPTLTLVAEALGNPSMPETARDQLRRAIAQTVQAAQAAQAGGSGQWSVAGGQSPAAAHVPPGAGAWPGSAGVPPAWGAGPAYGVPGYGPATMPGTPLPPTPPGPVAPFGGVPGAAPAGMPVLSPDAPPDTRGALLAGLIGGWQTVDEAAAELRVTAPYVLSLVQAGQLRAWSLPGGQPGSLAGLRVRREDVLALLQPVRL